MMTRVFKDCIECNGTSSCSIDPNYISGLTQADGSFSCSVSEKISSSSFLSNLKLCFTITQDLNSIFVLRKVMCYFQCGSVYIKTKTHSAEYQVSSKKFLLEIIFPHFERYSLYLAKQRSFLILKWIANKISSPKYLEYASEILALSFLMNGLTQKKMEKEKRIFKALKIVKTKIRLFSPKIVNHQLTDQFIIGLIDGDGCFAVIFESTGKIRFNFHISQDPSQEALLREVMKYLECGTI
jgi:LAGLIDADG endonuclease